MPHRLEESASIGNEVCRSDAKISEDPKSDLEVVDRGSPAPERRTASTHKCGTHLDIVMDFAVDQHHALRDQMSKAKCKTLIRTRLPEPGAVRGIRCAHLRGPTSHVRGVCLAQGGPNLVSLSNGNEGRLGHRQ